jgi:SAM-dependent methyltransferase
MCFMGKSVMKLEKNPDNVIACPYCLGTLTKLNGDLEGFKCENCGALYPIAKNGAWDLRLKQDKDVRYVMRIPRPPIPHHEYQLLKPNPQPKVDFSKISLKQHLSKELSTYFPRGGPGKIALDLGCGDEKHREACEYAGFQYIGIDYDNPDASILGDAHALPLQSESVDFILCLTVLEHIRYHQIMMKEAFRVLKPGGLFLGTSAFLEPFHSDSYYHSTHLGLHSSLTDGGFDVQMIAPYTNWSGLKAITHMKLFPLMPKILTNLLIYPLILLSNMYWKLGSKLDNRMNFNRFVWETAGSFAFIARKNPTEQPYE